MKILLIAGIFFLGSVCGLSSFAQDSLHFKTGGVAFPQVPSNLEVPKGTKMIAHVFAKGVQIYKCVQNIADTTKFTWVFVAPEATLYADIDYQHIVGKHYEGPAWESTDGSKVTGVKLQQAEAPDPGDIPWLLLRSASNTGPGIFNQVSFIQRVNTKGGKAPSVVQDRVRNGEELRVAYTAEYFFYGAK